MFSSNLHFSHESNLESEPYGRSIAKGTNWNTVANSVAGANADREYMKDEEERSRRKMRDR